ncbi:MAG: LPS-assembly protein LptD [Pseudomonadota bacterium]
MISRLYPGTARQSLMSAACAIALFAGSEMVVTTMSFAQATGSNALVRPRNPDAQMLLQSDEVVYDNDAQTVTAVGNVQIDYDGTRLVADRVIYNQGTGRVKAIGNVEVIEPDGNRIYTDTIDVTDDFGQGFIQSLRVETTDNTRFAAESGERLQGGDTVLHQGVYTACEPCKKDPKKPPLWQVKATKITVDGKTRSVTYRNARLEFFGLPIAYFPWFKHADPTIKRKSGFLLPGFDFSSERGFGLTVPYFLVTGDTHDLTVSGTYYTRQGFLGEAEWRQQFDNGKYNLRVAGISQMDPGAFSIAPDTNVEERGFIASKGEFQVNPYWSFGWDVMAQTDLTFARTYELKDRSDQFETSEVYLRGIKGRSYFDLSAYHFTVQSGPTSVLQDRQALVHPVLDYNFVKARPVLGGQFSFDVNATSLTRTQIDTVTPTGSTTRFNGIDGNVNRVSIDAEWKRTFNNSLGMMLTPIVAVRGDGFYVQSNSGSNPAGLDTGGSFRGMATLGLEYRWPLLFKAGNTQHIVEPIAQVFARPGVIGSGIRPNEDAQSLVFDTTNLFERDKFSGFDRIEGGTRANVGIRYSGILNRDWNIDAMAGQSYHLAGSNPYGSTSDLVNVGLDSGLETTISDFVGSFGFAYRDRFRAETRARIDERNFSLQRWEATGYATSKYLDLSGGYTFIGAQPNSGFNFDREQAHGYARLKFGDNWSVTGSLTYDIVNNTSISESLGINYHDECFTYSLNFTNSRDRFTNNNVGQTIYLKIGLRTIGDIQTSQGVGSTASPLFSSE